MINHLRFRSLFSAGLLAGVLLVPTDPARGEAPEALRERQEKIQKVAREAAPAVVALVPDTDRTQGSSRRNAYGSGSGVIVSRDGLILTAAHVVDAVGDEFAVIFSDGRKAKAKALGKNLSRDAGLAQITTKGDYPFVDQADPEAVKEGDWCLALGHPGGYEIDRPAPLRLGRVLDRDVDGFIVTDCTLSGGDSGGPLFNLDGKLIGIHSSIGWRLAENRHVPLEAYKSDWDRLMRGDSWGRLGLRDRRDPRSRGRVAPDPSDEPDPNQPVLGVMVDEANSAGALVAAVGAGSPASKAGVRAGDVIEKVNEEPIADQEALVKTIRKMKAGDRIKLAVKRGSDSVNLETTLVAAKDLPLE